MDSPSHVFDDGHKTFSPTYIENMVNMPRIGWILGQTEPFFGSDLGGALYLWICLSETELFNSDFNSQYLSTWSSDSYEIWLIYKP